MRALYTADTHLTSLPDDEYRWTVFEWMKMYAENENLDCIWILGDLTDRKDEHPAQLVNRLCDELDDLTRFCPVYIIKGNHDYVDAKDPFFRFLNKQPCIRYFTKPTSIKLHGLKIRVLPHVHKWRSLYLHEDFADFDRVFFHQAIQGATGSNGHEVSGMPRSRFDSVSDKAFCLGGDIHQAQTLGRARYVGAPHPIHFGDDYTPQGVLERDGRLKTITRTTLKKALITLTDVEDLFGADLSEGDRLRVTVKLPRSEFVHWDTHRARVKEIAQEMGVQLYGVKLKELASKPRLMLGQSKARVQSFNPLAVFDRFTAARGMDSQMAALGRSLLENDCGGTQASQPSGQA